MLLTTKKIMLTLLSTVLAGSVIGCSSGSGGGSTASDKPETAPLKQVNGKFDPPVTITTVRGVPGPATFKNGESIDDNVHTRWAKEKLGIEIKSLWSVVNTNNAYDTKLKLALSANEPMPDIVHASGEMARLLIESGRFQDAGALFDKYAGETWKKAMAEDPTVWFEYSREGKRYGIPALDYDYNNDPVMWVRGDWMKKLNLTQPKTIDDYEKILDAFTNQDPDGDGQKNTFGLSVGFKKAYANHFGVSWLFGAYGAIPGIWQKQPDGTLAYGSVQPGVKEALAKLKSWVAKGYIPKEAPVWDEAKAGSFVSAGRAGSFTGPYWSEAWPMGDLTKNNPSAELATYTLPVGSNGKGMHFATHPYAGAIFINKEMKNPEAFFTYGNFLFDNLADPKAGSEFENGWAKGYDWDVVDGKVTTDLTKIPGGGVRVFFYSLLMTQGPRIPSQNITALVNLAKSGNKPTTPYERYWSQLAPPIELQSSSNVWNQRANRVMNAYTGGATATMTDKGDFLNKLEMETFSKIVFGDEPVEAYDKFIQTWKSQGGDAITKEVNDWYKSVSKK
ncbi:extracellular solute-binding protein [Paenibacillus silviterrae]|uniref:extracellular solute-binding protein n=1 Tax=Paenibacillus silviterrae TaxID=3242194 RepID=UPI0025437338|nr:extracellular solute-binding protein [Paenibacillus chinjuensis]